MLIKYIIATKLETQVLWDHMNDIKTGFTDFGLVLFWDVDEGVGYRLFEFETVTEVKERPFAFEVIDMDDFAVNDGLLGCAVCSEDELVVCEVQSECGGGTGGDSREEVDFLFPGLNTKESEPVAVAVFWLRVSDLPLIVGDWEDWLFGINSDIVLFRVFLVFSEIRGDGIFVLLHERLGTIGEGGEIIFNFIAILILVEWAWSEG